MWNVQVAIFKVKVTGLEFAQMTYFIYCSVFWTIECIHPILKLMCWYIISWHLSDFYSECKRVSFMTVRRKYPCATSACFFVLQPISVCLSLPVCLYVFLCLHFFLQKWFSKHFSSFVWLALWQEQFPFAAVGAELWSANGECDCVQGQHHGNGATTRNMDTAPDSNPIPLGITAVRSLPTTWLVCTFFLFLFQMIY